MGARAHLAALLIAVTAVLMAPAMAFGHAQMTSTSPQRGETLPQAPQTVEIEFNEPVEASFGALKLFSSDGEQVSTPPVERPQGRSDALAIRPPADLPDGAYTVTYRVVSADSHLVSGGFVFSIGKQGTAPLTVAELLEQQGESGFATKALFAAVRVLSYASLAGLLGGLLFGFAIWRRPRIDVADERRFFAITRKVLTVSGLVLALCAIAGIALQGAVASGTDIPAALDGDVLQEVLGTRYGETALVRAIAGLGFAVLALRLPLSSPTTPTARSVLFLISLPAAIAALSFGFGGHAGAVPPAWLMVPASFGHVVAMAGWFGGLGILLWVIPRITRRLSPGERSALLATLIGRFSTLALWAVAILLISGIAQSVIHLDYIDELWQSRYGNLILLKAVLFSLLIAIGWFNRQRLKPRLAEAARENAAPGSSGRALRSALRAEICLALGVLTASAVLVSLAPASSTEAVFSETKTMGPAEVEVVFDPPRVGTQEVHIYLFEGATGAQWDDFRELKLTATEPERQIGPIEIELQRAGPGHYLAGGDLIAVPGTWTLDLAIRASEFDAYDASFEMRVR